MSEMDDIYWALVEAKRAAESLSTWVRQVDARDTVRSMQQTIQRGIDAHEKLRASLRDGRKHIQMPEDFKMTECGCQWPNASPPCSWCTDPENPLNSEEQS